MINQANGLVCQIKNKKDENKETDEQILSLDKKFRFKTKIIQLAPCEGCIHYNKVKASKIRKTIEMSTTPINEMEFLI